MKYPKTVTHVSASKCSGIKIFLSCIQQLEMCSKDTVAPTWKTSMQIANAEQGQRQMNR